MVCTQPPKHMIRGAKGHINKRILLSGSKTQDKGKSKNHGCWDPYLCGAFWTPGYRNPFKAHVSPMMLHGPFPGARSLAPYASASNAGTWGRCPGFFVEEPRCPERKAFDSLIAGLRVSVYGLKSCAYKRCIIAFALMILYNRSDTYRYMAMASS